MQIVVSGSAINQAVISEENHQLIVQQPVTSIIELTTLGAQGPPGPTGGGVIVDSAAKVDKSVIYYDAETASFKADAIWTVLSLTDGGNF